MPLKHSLLTWHQRKQLHDRLAARASALREELRAETHDAFGRPGLGNRRAEVDDDAMADVQADLDVAAAVRDSSELDEVVRALEQIDSPAFGRCTGCGTPIAWARLLAQPHATRCTRCAAAAERQTPASL